MIPSFAPGAIVRSLLLSVLALSCAAPMLAATPKAKPAQAAAPKGLLHRVNKMEECLYGAPRKDKSLDARITELEAQTLGGGQKGPLAKRLENIEKLVNGQTTATNLIPPPTVAPPISKPNVDEMLRKGTAAHTSGKTEEAEKIFKDVLVTSPFNSNAMFNLGAIAESKGDLAGALGHYRTALIGAPNDPQIQQAIAQVESQIAQQAGSPFKTPVLSTADGGTLLQGNATEFDPLAAKSTSSPPLQAAATQNQLNAQATQPPPQPASPPRASAWRTAGVIGGSLLGGIARGAVQGAIRGGGSGAFSGAISSGSRGAVGSLLRAGGLGALHCPICRILP